MQIIFTALIRQFAFLLASKVYAIIADGKPRNVVLFIVRFLGILLVVFCETPNDRFVFGGRNGLTDIRIRFRSAPTELDQSECGSADQWLEMYPIAGADLKVRK